MDSPGTFPESPMEGDDVTYPCKGCGEILEEGKAFELAGNRWHIDCFRCNTCNTLLDSDANLLLLGDGSLICNSCTYSCQACGEKIEDLAILTGDQAFCANCFRCRNCRRKIDNLRYARTSQGIFCMTCHESLMARRRKKSRAAAAAAAAAQRTPSSTNSPMHLDKSLPLLPPNVAAKPDLASDRDTPSVDGRRGTPTELSPRPRDPVSRNGSHQNPQRDRSIAPSEESRKENVALPSSSSSYQRNSMLSQFADDSTSVGGRSEAFNIPLVLDPGLAPETLHMARSSEPDAETRDVDRRPARPKEGRSMERDYFAGGRFQPPSRQHSREKYSLNSRTSSLRDVNGHAASSEEPSPLLAHSETARQHHGESTEGHKSSITVQLERGGAEGLASKGASPGPSIGLGVEEIRPQQASLRQPKENGKIQSTYGENFTLQEVPRGKRSGPSARSQNSGSHPSSAGEETPQMATPSSTVENHHQSTSAQRHPASESDSPKSSMQNGDPRPDAAFRPRHPDDHPVNSTAGQESSLALYQMDGGASRGDAPGDVRSRKPVPRRVVMQRLKMGSSSNSANSQDHPDSGSSSVTTDSENSSPIVDLSSTVGTGDASTTKKSLPNNNTGESIDQPIRPPHRQTSSSSAFVDAFTAPRAPPQLPPHSSRRSSGTSPSELGRNFEANLPNTGLPPYSTGGDFSMEEDMARIWGSNDEGSASLLRRVSNVVKHGRSFSDMETRARLAKWPPKSPLHGGMASPREISSPTAASPDSRDENAQLKHELRRSAQRIVELEARVSGGTDMSTWETKMREKRSTVAFLDSQRQLIVRELEILTDHVAKAKNSREPLDMSGLKSQVVLEFAAALETLKSSFEPEIQALIRRKNELIEETTNLTRLRDQAIQETEQLNSKNAQLANLNNELTHQIQERYRAHREASSLDSRPLLNSLGIQGSHFIKVKGDLDLGDLREGRPATGYGPSNGSASTPVAESNEAEPAAVVTTAPHVVNLRRGQVKKFNWKKGGQSVAKGVSKGIKGAFSSNSQNQYQFQQKESGALETVPYGMAPVMEAPTTSLPGSGSNSRTNSDGPRHGLGIFGQKLGKSGPTKTPSNGNLIVAAAEAPSTLFGSELTERADFERRSIPTVVTRCIEEVELRGMDAEGIYRKSGGTSQMKMIQEGFERSNDYDISDPGLDIMAVSSVLKHYLRKLPTPLMTFDAYDGILEANDIVDEEKRAMAMRAMVQQLPVKHRDCLEFLIFHLARVATRHHENLMTPRNLAVVFAPTIMRDHSLDREMTDMHTKNLAIQFLIEQSNVIFATGDGV